MSGDTPPNERGIRALLRREAKLFGEHRVAYAALFVLKAGLFFVVLRFHRVLGVRGELIPALVLAMVGTVMTVLFHRGTNH